MNFSFFSRVPGGPGLIRGAQMAERLGGRLEPQGGYDNDVCVYICGRKPDGPEPRWAYYDVLDCGLTRLDRIRRDTKGPLIACSQTHEAELRRLLPGREVYLIPQHHCNFDRIRRARQEVEVVGCIGGDSAVQWPHEAVARECRIRGLGWTFGSHYSKRQYVVDFYQTIDVQLCFRPTHTRYPNLLHMNCLKLANAGSFGIPTVAFPEPAYTTEWPDMYYSTSLPALIRHAQQLHESPDLYAEYSAKALHRAESYHIDRIADLYRLLPGATA